MEINMYYGCWTVLAIFIPSTQITHRGWGNYVELFLLKNQCVYMSFLSFCQEIWWTCVCHIIQSLNGCNNCSQLFWLFLFSKDVFMLIIKILFGMWNTIYTEFLWDFLKHTELPGLSCVFWKPYQKNCYSFNQFRKVDLKDNKYVKIMFRVVCWQMIRHNSSCNYMSWKYTWTCIWRYPRFLTKPA